LEIFSSSYNDILISWQ